MRKGKVLALIIGAILVVSTTAVLSHPGWRGGNPWSGEEAELVTLEGTIKDADRPVVTMEAEGKEYILHLGPVWYWQEKGYKLEKDQAVKVTGMVEEIEGKLHFYPHTMESGGESIVLADENCVPVWAGQRGGRGPGFGRGYHGQCEYGPGHGWHGRGNMHGWDGHHMYGGRGRGFRGCGW